MMVVEPAMEDTECAVSVVAGEIGFGVFEITVMRGVT
jgi:hypothetical protein